VTPMTPWAERFSTLTSAEIRARATHIPQPLVGLNEKGVETAADELNAAFEQLFVPTAQTMELLEEQVQIALAHCLRAYPDLASFRRIVFDPDCAVPFPASVAPICLTGPAGCGKSALITALRRILGDLDSIVVGPGYPRFPLVPMWHLGVGERMSAAQLLGDLGAGIYIPEVPNRKSRRGQSSKEKRPVATKVVVRKLVANARRRAYQTGAAVLTADEFQFATRSKDANTLLTLMLSVLSSVGLPLLFAANYSLGHRLSLRPHEDRQRLLTQPRVLLPDAPDSLDWIATVEGHRNIAPEVFRFDPRELAARLYVWTAGLKRCLRFLLVLAYRRARRANGIVNEKELEWAYNSVAYGVNRTDIKLILLQNATGKIAEAKRRDLWCPFELPPSVVAETRRKASTRRVDEMKKLFLATALTRAERQAYEEIQRAAEKDSARRADVVPIRRGRTVTADDLRAGEAVFLSTKRK